MKLLVLASRFPLPLEKGDKLRLFHQVEFLARHHHVILVALETKPFQEALVGELRPYCKEIYVIPVNRISHTLQAGRNILRGMPVNVGYFYSEGIRKKIGAIVEKTRPDAIYVQLIRMAGYVSDLPSIPKIIDYMDAFSLRIMRRADHTGGAQSLLWKMEAKWLRRFEKKVAPYFDRRFVIASSDQDHLQQLGVRDLEILPNGVDTDYFKPNGRLEQTFDIVFVGNMSYHPNIWACQILIDQIAVPLRQTYTGLSVLIAGADPEASILDLTNDWITVESNLPDIRTAYSRGKIFVAPIHSGSGMQNKILEAMAMAVPCVTSSQVVEAIGAPAEVIYTADQPAQYLGVIKLLLDDPVLRKDIGIRARQYAEKQYNWASCSAPLVEALDHLI